MMHLDTRSPVRAEDHTTGSSSSRTLVPVTACLLLLLVVPYFLLRALDRQDSSHLRCNLVQRCVDNVSNDNCCLFL